ncbi:MAG: PAS domain S-box protein [Deltaproteobacteria bacterium]|nr:PAS domain S-box protein [Deltaproteobacteria bacterium]
MNKFKAENRAMKEKIAALGSENKWLRKSLKNKDRLFDGLPMGVAVIQDQKVIEINKTALDVLGCNAGDILGRNILSFVPPDIRDIIKKRQENRGPGKRSPDQYETDLVSKDGQVFRCEMKVEKILYNGRRAFLFSIYSVEKRKRIEREQIHLEKMKFLNRMASSLTPLLKMNLKTISDNVNQIRAILNPDNTGLSQSLDHIENAVSTINATNLKLDMLSMSSYDASEVSSFDLRQTVRDAIKKIAPRLRSLEEKRDIKISLKTYLRSVSEIRGNPEAIQDVIINLIMNALDAMPRGGELYVTTEQNMGSGYIYIQDNGVGIPDQLDGHILEPFFTTKAMNGTGLGLSICYAIVKRHRGDLEVTGKKGQGTTITVRLPLAGDGIKKKSGSLKRKIKNARILIIESHVMISDLLSQILKGKGYRVVTATTDLEGLERIKNQRFDMVVADLNHSKRRANQFIRKVKKYRPELPVALIAEPDDGDTNVVGDQWAPDLIVHKPIDINRVVEQIPKILTRPPRSRT